MLTYTRNVTFNDIEPLEYGDGSPVSPVRYMSGSVRQRGRTNPVPLSHGLASWCLIHGRHGNGKVSAL